MTQAANDLLRLVQIGAVTTGKIADTSVQAEVIAALKAKVAAGEITADQYQAFTGAVYSA